MKHVVVAYDKSKWCAVPANNGANGPQWQWGDEILIGYTCGEALFTDPGHQVDYINPHISYLARSMDGGENWTTWRPDNYPGCAKIYIDEPQETKEPLDLGSPGFAMRIEGNGYHGNSGNRWFYSMDKGSNWKGPFSFGNLLSHTELAGKEFTGRTAYLVDGSKVCLIFLSVRESKNQSLGVSVTDKVFLAKTTDGLKSFEFISWVVSPDDPHRAVMPAPVSVSDQKLIASVRRKDKKNICWLDCYGSDDNGDTWEHLSRIAETGGSNGNPPAMVKMSDGRICCVYGNRDKRQMLAVFSKDEGKSWYNELVLRDEFVSKNGYADLGYPRLFERTDGKLVAVYFWCSEHMPETHIEATIFSPSQ